MFVHQSYGLGVSVGLLIELFFHIYLIWIVGSAVAERVDPRAFLRLYLGTGVATGVIAFFLMATTGASGVLAGATPPILALVMIWTMLYPEAQVLLFFVFPVKAKWLMAGVVGAILLVNLSQGDFFDMLAYMSGIVIGYGYGIVVQGLSSPFPATRALDTAVRRWATGWRRRSKPQPASTQRSNKIIDITTAEAPMSDDDTFVDKMLDKIATGGEASLSRSERKRLEQISAKKGRR